MRVLSLFDGMSCGQIALRDLGIAPEVYYASEVDKYAIAQTKLNFPDTIQLGDVQLIDPTQLGHIDLLIGGSPCQNLSIAGHSRGLVTKENRKVLTLQQYLDLKESGFEFEGQSYLFWEYIRILTELKKLNPNVKFLLENVKMKKEWEQVLTEAIGVPGVHINSGLVSAQIRKRIYWTNIGHIDQPADRGLLLKDILEPKVDEKYFASENMIDWMVRHAKKRGTKIPVRRPEEKCQSITATAETKGNLSTNWIAVEDTRPVNLMNQHQYYRVYEVDGKSPTLLNSHYGWSHNVRIGERIRKLTPTECARLQTIPDWYQWNCSNKQQYRMLGNGWTVEVIKHIFSYL